MKLSQITDNIGGLNKNINLMSSLDATSKQGNSNDSFSQMLKDSIEQVNQTQVNAYDAMKGVATGKVDNLQDAIHKIEQAELSLKLGLEVKNKALGAYKQVMSMQV